MDNKSLLPQRKHTRLKNFDYSTVGAYFVTVCTQNRQRILSEIVLKDAPSSNDINTPQSVGDGAPDVPHIRLSPTGEIVEKYLLSSNNIPSVEIDEYGIMPDHIHAIIFIKPNKSGTSRAPSPTAANELLPQVISAFKRFCNREIGENIFQRSYMEHVIRDRRDYETKRKYIHENPIRRYYRERENE